MKTVVCDTGPILHLIEINLLDLLRKAGKVIIPTGVDIELSEINLSWKEQKPSWISVERLPPNDSFNINALYNSGLLGIGETEAIILAQRLNADWFLTDDTSARVFANVIGLEVHGTLGVLLWAGAMLPS
jgi:predicted nucleic acid-binding protein